MTPAAQHPGSRDIDLAVIGEQIRRLVGLDRHAVDLVRRDP